MDRTGKRKLGGGKEKVRRMQRKDGRDADPYMAEERCGLPYYGEAGRSDQVQ